MLDFGDAFIAHSRNKLVDSYLATGIEYLLKVDDDMILPFGNAPLFKSFTGFDYLPDRCAGFNSVSRLLSHGKTLVGGLYFDRWGRGTPVYGEGADPQEAEFARRAPHDILKPTRWVGTGAMLIHRSVFLDIEKEFPYLARNPDTKKGGQWFTSGEHDVMSAVDSLLGLDDVSDPWEAIARLRNARELSRRNSNLGIGEDVQFCVRAKQAGHQPYVDMSLVCGHLGEVCRGPRP
jgi:hypothetical protein